MENDEHVIEQDIWMRAFFECVRTVSYSLEEKVAYANGAVDAYRKYFKEEIK